MKKIPKRTAIGVASGFLAIIGLLAGIVFAFFAFMMVLQLIFTHFIMPETKGVSLEDLSKKLIRN